MRATAEARQIPDIRDFAAGRRTKRQQRWRQSHWLIRPFLFVYCWLEDYP